MADEQKTNPKLSDTGDRDDIDELEDDELIVPSTNRMSLYIFPVFKALLKPID